MYVRFCMHARHLLSVGLGGLEGVVYLDDLDRKMIVTRSGGMRPLLLADCHVPPDLRFTFYDQVHTTGMYVSIESCAAGLSFPQWGTLAHNDGRYLSF